MRMKQKQDVSSKSISIDDELRKIKLAGLSDLLSRNDDVIEQLEFLAFSPYVAFNSATYACLLMAWKSCKLARRSILYECDNI